MRRRKLRIAICLGKTCCAGSLYRVVSRPYRIGGKLVSESYVPGVAWPGGVTIHISGL